MLFTGPQMKGIVAGRITVTVRTWNRALVSAGKPYRFGNDAYLVVESVEVLPPEEIGAADAIGAGFDGTDALLADIRTRSNGELPASVYVVRFRYVGERLPRPGEGKPIEELTDRLAKIDARSARGPWALPALQAIASRPHTRAPDLAAELGRDTLPFKADVRKLKEMGLTRSFEVGYDLTDSGREVLAQLEARARSSASA
ncbi:hypothetical protein AYO38_06485 [bacterium SCGC AG-212-C10]|nr:hypothetical protein AYO38_06485 [bacterium SCGC AG-212-C10]